MAGVSRHLLERNHPRRGAACCCAYANPAAAMRWKARQNPRSCGGPSGAPQRAALLQLRLRGPVRAKLGAIPQTTGKGAHAAYGPCSAVAALVWTSVGGCRWTKRFPQWPPVATSSDALGTEASVAVSPAGPRRGTAHRRSCAISIDGRHAASPNNSAQFRQLLSPTAMQDLQGRGFVRPGYAPAASSAERRQAPRRCLLSGNQPDPKAAGIRIIKRRARIPRHAALAELGTVPGIGFSSSHAAWPPKEPSVRSMTVLPARSLSSSGHACGPRKNSEAIRMPQDDVTG